MSRNLKSAYINKIRNTFVPNGYAFDLANYLYNPSSSYDYPSFCKVVSEDGKEQTIRRVYYYKHYDGIGEYCEEIYSLPKETSGWAIIRGSDSRTLEKSTRFSLKKLLTFCE